MKNVLQIQNKTLYPSKQEIINHPKLITQNQIYSLQRWKNNYYIKSYDRIQWSGQSIEEKNKALSMLLRLYITGTIYNTHKAVEDVERKFTNQYATDLESHTLYFNEVAPSIISTLHEVGHLIYGPSELKACAYSYQLFNAVFPTECASLEWCGHMLVKKQQTKRENLGQHLLIN